MPTAAMAARGTRLGAETACELLGGLLDYARQPTATTAFREVVIVVLVFRPFKAKRLWRGLDRRCYGRIVESLLCRYKMTRLGRDGHGVLVVGDGDGSLQVLDENMEPRAPPARGDCRMGSYPLTP